ncbi:MAG: hypothetical protein AAF394_04250 [Planctomycetota bacterium]
MHTLQISAQVCSTERPDFRSLPEPSSPPLSLVFYLMSLAKQPQRSVHRLLRARDWQDRPQFREVCDWWSDGGGGVLALVGIGGSGKTAITERFLPPLGRVFVFSFYDAPNPDSFVAELGSWLQASSGGFQLPAIPTVRLQECPKPPGFRSAR